MAGVIILILVAVVVIVYGVLAVHIVRQYQRAVIERLGRYRRTVDPGLRIIVPFVDHIQKVDMRERLIDVPPQEVITSDNVTVTIDAVVFYEATDPRRLLYQVENYTLAVVKLAQTNLRNLVGEMSLDEALTSRDRINVKLREVLDEATDAWGSRVNRVEIQKIDPPVDVVDAMHHQMKAERMRRAVVTEADGAREAAIAIATGDKESAILTAEGFRQRRILEAEGQAQGIRSVADAERHRTIALAEGEAEATRETFGAIHDGDPSNDLIAVKYLEALAAIADGRATKIFLPIETASIYSAIGGVAELFTDVTDGGVPRRGDEKERAGLVEGGPQPEAPPESTSQA